jgi:hypothetical protein
MRLRSQNSDLAKYHTMSHISGVKSMVSLLGIDAHRGEVSEFSALPISTVSGNVFGKPRARPLVIADGQ